MNFLESEFYHLYNRGNQQQTIFFNTENYLYFLRKVRRDIVPYCDILAYCLMPNHFHFLIRVKGSGQVSGSHQTTCALKMESLA